MPPDEAHHNLVLVTGPSGAGRGTAIRALEDMGFETIDNLPLSFLPRLLDGPGLERPLALGIDVRNRDFSTTALIDVIDQLGVDPGTLVQVLYLDCGPEVLLRRYSETRRRHPLAASESAEAGIAREYDLLAPIRARADILIDSSELTPHDLRAELERWFLPDGKRRLTVSLQSFSYKRGLPRSLDLVFDCRFLKNPHWDRALRALDGRDRQVQDYIAGDERFFPFQNKVFDLIDLLLPAYEAEGKAYLSIGFGCTGGQHRSVAMAETLTKALADSGWRVSTRHRELERRSSLAPGTQGQSG